MLTFLVRRASGSLHIARSGSGAADDSGATPRLLLARRRSRNEHLPWLYLLGRGFWLRGQDLNLRPSGYEPDELPGCSTPRLWCVGGIVGEVLGLVCVFASLLGGPGGDLLFHALGRSTIGAEGFHGRVRDGIGCFTLAMATRSSKQRGWVCVAVPSWFGVFVVFRRWADRVSCWCGFVRTHGGVWGSSSLSSD